MPNQNATLIQENPRPKLQGRAFSNWSLPDVMLGVLLAMTIVVALWQLGLIGGIVSAAFLGLLARTQSSYARLYQDLGKEIAGGWREGFHKGVWWRAEDNEGSNLARWLRARHSPLPISFVRIQTEIEGVVERFCLLHQTDRPYDHLLITAEGGSFASADVNEQTRLVEMMNGILDQIVSQSDLKAGISHVSITNPFNQMVMSRNLATSMSPILARPELFKLDNETASWVDWAQQNARQIPVTLEKYRAANSQAFIVITIKRRRKWRDLTSKQIAETPIIELGKALIDGLREQDALKLQNIHSPNLPDLALIIRSAWDITGINGYYRDRENGVIPTTDEGIDDVLAYYRQEAEVEAELEKRTYKRKSILASGATKGAQEVDNLLRAWPERCIETNEKENYLRFDDSYIAMLRVTELPKQFRSDKIMSLHWLVKDVWTRFAFVGESTSGSTQTNMLIYKASLEENFNRAFFGRHIVKDPRRTARSRKTGQELEQMSLNTIAQLSNGIVTIIERDPDRLRRAVKKVKARYNLIGFKTEQVKGSARLIDYFITGLGVNRA